MPDTLTATIVAATADIPAVAWNALVPGHDGVPDNPFVDHAFYLALEQAGCATRRTGWAPQHLVLSGDDDEIVGIMPMFLKSHSQGEYVFDHGWADAFSRAGGAYYPKLQCSVPFTPATGPRLLAHDDATRTALLRTAESAAARNDISSIHMTFVGEQEAALARASGWIERHDLQYHWHNHDFADFEDFLGTLSSRHRKVTRRERRDATEGLTVKWLTGPDITEAAWDAFFDFYMDTGSRKWGRPYLNRKFFSLLGDAMADRILLIIAYDSGRPIAGTLNLIGHDTLFGRYWGAVEHVPFLHFELCYYQAIDFAIDRGLAVVEAGAQGEHKLARGYEPTVTRSMHWIGHPGLREAIADYVARERNAMVREEAMLSRHTPFRRGPEEAS